MSNQTKIIHKFVTAAFLILIICSKQLIAETYKKSPFKLNPIKPESSTTVPNIQQRFINQREDIEVKKKKENKVIVGIKGGIALTTVQSDSSDEQSYLTQGIGGLYFEYFFNPYLSLEFDLFYNQKGALSKGTYEAESIVTYISYIPLVKGYPVKDYFYLLLGPSVHVRLKDSQTISPPYPDGTSSQSNFTKTLTIGITFGLGVFYEFDPVIICLEGRYDLGITKANEPSKSGGTKAYFRDIQILGGVGLSF